MLLNSLFFSTFPRLKTSSLSPWALIEFILYIYNIYIYSIFFSFFFSRLRLKTNYCKLTNHAEEDTIVKLWNTYHVLSIIWELLDFACEEKFWSENLNIETIKEMIFCFFFFDILIISEWTCVCVYVHVAIRRHLTYIFWHFPYYEKQTKHAILFQTLPLKIVALFLFLEFVSLSFWLVRKQIVQLKFSLHSNIYNLNLEKISWWRSSVSILVCCLYLKKKENKPTGIIKKN